MPGRIRSDNGPEFVATSLRKWIAALGAETAYSEPGSPWENGTVESFNSKFRDELPCGETFHTLREAQLLIEAWRRHHNALRPHSALGWRPPAPEVRVAGAGAWPPSSPVNRMAPVLAADCHRAWTRHWGTARTASMRARLPGRIPPPVVRGRASRSGPA